MVAVASAEADYRIDVYGLRGENGPLPLRKIDSRDALAMISNPKPLREKDKFFSFDMLGSSRSIGSNMAFLP
jgi:hypothetical protein